MTSDDENFTVPESHDQPIGVIAPGGLFYLASRKLWMLNFAPDALTIPPGVTIDIGDYLGIISPEGVAYSGTIMEISPPGPLGSAAQQGGRAGPIEIGLDGEGERLDEVQVGWEVHMGSYRHTRLE